MKINILRKICFLLFATLIPIIGIEIFLKIFSPIRFAGSIGNYEYHPIMGTVIKKGYFTKTTDHKQEIFVNKLGTVNTQQNFKGYKKKAFAIGDSFTQVTGSSLSASYPVFADIFINTKSGKYEPNLGIINLGTSANGGLQNIENYKIYKSKIGIPDYIFYLGSDNDYIDDLRFKSGLRHKQIVDGSPYWGALVKPLQILSKIEIVKRLKILRRDLITKNLSKSKNDFSKESICKTPAEKSKPILDKFLELSLSDDFILVISWESYFGNDKKECSSYSWAKKWAKNNNVRFADYQYSVSSTKLFWTDMPYVNDHSGGHYRDWINFLIAKSFAAHVPPIK